MSFSLAVRAALVGLALAAAAPAHASLIGDQLTAVYSYPTPATPYSSASFTPAAFTVGPGQETLGNVENVTFLGVDFSASALAITLSTSLTNPAWNANGFNGIVFTSPDPLGITAAVVDPATTMAGFDDSRVSFSQNQILVDWHGLSYVDGTVVQVDFTFPPSPPATVPEPATGAMVGTALFGLGAIMRRRSKSTGTAA